MSDSLNYNHGNDITRQIISTAYVSQNVHRFFSNSLFLDHQYNIVAVSEDMCLKLDYNCDELKGRPLAALVGDIGNALVSNCLQAGYFSNERLRVSTKSGQEIDYFVSGFYLGILSPCSNLIVLRFDACAEALELNQKLAQTRSQLDNFIYRTSHDLRGPLATIQGLVNLLNMRKDDREINNFLSLIDVNCKKLDERLTHLAYLSKADDEFELPSFSMRVSDIETALRKTIERNGFVDHLRLWVTGNADVIEGFNEVLTLSVINNLLMYVLSLPLTGQGNIYLEISGQGALRLVLSALGFKKDATVEQFIQDPDASHYVDVLQRWNLTYLYAALKIATHLKASIAYAHDGEVVQKFEIRVPRHS